VFFALSKILWFCFRPSSLIIFAMVAGLVPTLRGRPALARRLQCAGVAALLVTSFSPLVEIMMRPLEERFNRPDLTVTGSNIDGIIVLGGGQDADLANLRGTAGLSEAAERLTETVVLSRRFPAARIVFTGGSGAVLSSQTPEADAAGRLFGSLGLSKSRITLETRSRNTYENAVFTKALVAPKPSERWLLVTSALHMPRAMGCFRQVGIAIEPWPVDFRTLPQFALSRSFLGFPEGLREFDGVMKEYIGLLFYRLTGRTDALLPGPEPAG
jgi:uncharacterized SAM-binding protein YcdF (DUF218 family)